MSQTPLSDISAFCNPKQTKSKSQRLAAGETGIRYADPSLEMIIRWVLLSQTQHLSFGILHEHQGKVILVVAKRRPTKVWRCRGLQCGKLNAKRCPIDNMEVFDIFCANCNFNLKIDRKLNPDRRRFPQRHSLLAGDQPCVPQAARASANRKARDHADAALCQWNESYSCIKHCIHEHCHRPRISTMFEQEFHFPFFYSKLFRKWHASRPSFTISWFTIEFVSASSTKPHSLHIHIYIYAYLQGNRLLFSLYIDFTFTFIDMQIASSRT